MNNILNFEQYREQVRLFEENLVKSQILQPLDESLRGKIRKKINAKAEVFVRAALADEIEMGRQLNEAIQSAVDDLKEYIEKIQEFVDDNTPEKTELFKKLEKMFDDIHKASFELLEILSGVNINFADYVQNATMATFVNFGVMFIPTRSIFLLKKSYKYFIGLIKNTIRKDMLMLMLNFDQFENTVLIQSLEDDEQTQWNDEMKIKMGAYEELASKLLVDTTSKKKGVNEKEAKRIKNAVDALRKGVEVQMKLRDRGASTIGFDSKYDNTYTKTLDQLKSFVLEDDTKYLDAIKNGMRTQALDEVDTKSYVELLISAAEECAYEVSNAIHTNFIEKVSVFKLANQKRLIELVKKDKELLEKQKEKDEKKRIEELDKLKDEKFEKVVEEHGEEIFNRVTEGSPEEQVEKYKKLGKKEYDGDEYNEKDILTAWLSKFDIDEKEYKTWDEKKGDISDLLKLYFADVVPNEDSYLKYADLLVDCLLPCAFKKGSKEIKVTEHTYIYKYAKDKEETEKVEDIKKTDAPVFTVEALKRADDRERRLKDCIFKEDVDEGKFVYELDENKTKLLKEALKLISENLVKLESDVIFEVLCHLYEKDDKAEDGYKTTFYIMSETIMDDILKEFNRLKELKANEYDTSTPSKSDEKEK
jgi:hypothetical protein